MQDQIAIQRKKLEQGNPAIDLTEPCRIGSGISQFSASDRTNFLKIYSTQKENLDICFFVPASGSGSRMFSSLYEFLNDPDNPDATKTVDLFIAQIQHLAIYYHLSDKWKEKLSEGEFEKPDFIRYLLTETGLNFGNLPKGLIPFHIYAQHITNPFQEHLLQGTIISDESSLFHFTINNRFETEIEAQIRKLERRENVNYIREFSEQDPSTDAVAFTDDLEPAVDGQGLIITRPAGHGTLIKNLNTIDADLIFIRNIDNMQHLSGADVSIETRKILAGALLEFQAAVFEILTKIEREESFIDSVKILNEKYDLRIPSEKFTDKDFILHFLMRPIRVCGMVKNEGAPGGGPFWVRDKEGIESRQIIEKSQIEHNSEQLKLMATATHFNPVEIVCGVRNFRNQKFDLPKFVNEDQYFIVQKTHEGQSIKYIEQPGLWNGGMANWLTLFYEIDSTCFSPVKTVMDLLEPAHLERELKSEI